MDAKSKSAIEYQEQHFNFSSELFLESMKEMFKDNIHAALEAAINLLRKKLQPVAVSPESLEKSFEEFISSLSAEYFNGVEYAATCVEAKIRECLSIPDWVVLEEDRIVLKVENESEEDLDNDIKKLKEELASIRVLSEKVKDELITCDIVIPTLNNCNNILSVDEFPVMD